MKKINYKSDFDFVLKLVSCVKAEDGTITKTDVGFPDHDWTATFWTSSKANAYVASSKGGVLTNCFNDDGQIHVVCNAHKLGVGELKCEYHAALPNVMYPDGSCDVYEPQELDIELWAGQSDCPTEMVVEMGLSAMYRSVYEDAVQAGFEGTKEEYYQRLTELPDSVEVATTIRQSVEDINKASKDISAMVADIGSMASDMTAGKKKVIDALARRGYELPTDVSYNEMADVIEHMTWGEGILAKIGYEGEEDYEQLSQEIAKSYRAKQLYESGEIDSLYECGIFAPKVTIKDGNADYLFCNKSSNTARYDLRYVPILSPLKSCAYMFFGCSNLKFISQLDTRNVTNMKYMFAYSILSSFSLDTRNVANMEGMFQSCKIKTVIQLDTRNVTTMYLMFSGCNELIEVPELDTRNVTNMQNLFQSCSSLRKVALLDFNSVTNTSGFVSGCASLVFLNIVNLGKIASTLDLSGCSVWGSTEEGRQSLIDSLITNSYDRAANGKSACKITLHANVKARLTDEEKAAITAKGFTIA